MDIRVDEVIKVTSKEPIGLLEDVPQVDIEVSVEGVTYLMPVVPNNALLTGLAARGKQPTIDKESNLKLKTLVKKVTRPVAGLTPDKKYININIPLIKGYKELVKKLAAWPVAGSQGSYRIPISKLMTLDGLNNLLENLPPISYTQDLENFQTQPIHNFDGGVESLRKVGIGELNLIAADGQNRNALRKNNKTLEEKFISHGIENLYDLLFYFPRRYIDKTNPQLIDDLLEGESATIIGRITHTIEMRNNMGIIFVITTHDGGEIRSTFWRQSWLKRKFKIGDEVIVTGKVKYWKGNKQLNGTSIDHADEAEILPIVPIYPQSEAKGITTYLVMAALRELLDRLGSVSLPKYFKKNRRENFDKILEEMHFPTSLEAREKAMRRFAYYELVYMQLLMEEERQELSGKKGIKQEGSDRHLQEKAIETLPFELTNSQKKATKIITESLAKSFPGKTLVNSDVGTGKTIVAQLACLQSVESGNQAVIVAPTGILAQQLYSTTKKLIESINTKFGENIRVEFFSTELKAAEKRELLKEIEEGEVDILVGTPAVMGKSVKYKNLGLVCIDEEQRYGTGQKYSLLESREDGLIPDLITMTATPIPRSIAQVFYGDTEMIALTDKPAGRLPIETIWLEENPQEIISEIVSPLWDDVVEEAKKGHQTFIITPLVEESESVDAASVKKTFETLKTHSLSTVDVGMVHGRMKKEEQEKVMEAFRKGEYQVLVASTVVEVGVDVPTATRAVILSADRLGASSIWQVRGRVGRNDIPSKCYLVSSKGTDTSKERLQSIVDATDGFEVAKADLTVRGEGQVFGDSQSGKTEMVIASIGSHGRLVKIAKKEAAEIIESRYSKEALSDAYRKFEVESKKK